MIAIIEGTNGSGKTSAIEEMKKNNPEMLFLTHQRFNDADYYNYNYHTSYSLITNENSRIEKSYMYVPTEIVYQITHTSFLKFITEVAPFLENMSIPIISDRSFMSEMAYRDYFCEDLYSELANALKKLKHKVFILNVSNETRRSRLLADRTEEDYMNKKRFGRNAERKMNTFDEFLSMCDEIDNKYRTIVKHFDLDHVLIDTTGVTPTEIAEEITKELKVKK